MTAVFLMCECAFLSEWIKDLKIPTKQSVKCIKNKEGEGDVQALSVMNNLIGYWKFNIIRVALGSYPGCNGCVPSKRQLSKHSYLNKVNYYPTLFSFFSMFNAWHSPRLVLKGTILVNVDYRIQTNIGFHQDMLWTVETDAAL